MRKELLECLNEEQIAKIRACKNQEEIMDWYTLPVLLFYLRHLYENICDRKISTNKSL